MQVSYYQNCDDFSTSTNTTTSPITQRAWSLADALGFVGNAASQFSQGFIHAIQNRRDLLGESAAYDAGFNAAQADI